MANVFFTPTLYLKTTLMQLGDRLNITRNMSSEYSKLFGNKTAQVGNSYNLKKPARFIGTDDSLTYAGEDLTQQSFSITVDKTSSLYFGWDSFEATLRLEDVVNNYAKPAALALATRINAKAARYIAQNTFNSVGTPGTVPTAATTYLSAVDKLVKLGVPEGEDLNLVINRAMSSAYVGANMGQFNSQEIIGEQHRTGRMQDQLGVNIVRDESIYAHTTGAQGGTILVNGGGQTSADGNNGTGTLVVDGVTNSTLFAKQGDTFVIGTQGGAGVYSVHPQTRVSTGELQQFVVLADVTSNGSGQATISTSPALTATGQYQNVDSLPADNAPVTFWTGSGAASKVSKQGLLLHRNAFAFMSVPLANPSPNGVEMVASETDPDTGLSLQFIRWFDGNTRVWKNRFDCLYGFAPLYREMACRIAS